SFQLVVAALSRDQPDGAPAGILIRICNDLLEASTPAWVKDATTALAADWTDVETWSRPPRHGTTECADPEASWGTATRTSPGPQARCSTGTTCRRPPWWPRSTARPSPSWPAG